MFDEYVTLLHRYHSPLTSHPSPPHPSPLTRHLSLHPSPLTTSSLTPLLPSLSLTHPHSSPLTPHPSPLTRHISLHTLPFLPLLFLTPHSSPPHSSPLTPHSSPLPPHPSLLTPHPSLSPLPPHPSLLTPHPSPTPQIQGFPTIKAWPAGRKMADGFEEYNGGRTTSDIVQWALERWSANLPPPEIYQVVCLSVSVCSSD